MAMSRGMRWATAISAVVLELILAVPLISHEDFVSALSALSAPLAVNLNPAIEH